MKLGSFKAVIWGSLILSGLLCIYTSPIVFAMEVRPPLLEVSALPGKSSASVFLLKNTESIPQTYAFTIQGFVAQGMEGQQRFLSASETSGLPSWLYLPASRITLKAGEVASVSVLFRPPSGAEPGAYQAVVFASPTDPARRDGVTLGSRVGVLVFATVEGEVHRALRVHSLTRVSPNIAWHFDPRFEIVLGNEGNSHEMPTGQMDITNIFGQVVDVLPLQEKASPARIVPSSEHRFSLKDKRGLDFSDGWGFGWYHAQFLLGEPFQTRTDGGWFFVIPWKTAGACFVFIGGVWWWRRRA